MNNSADAWTEEAQKLRWGRRLPPYNSRFMGRRHSYSERIRAALRRLSREKWLSGTECRNIAMHLAWESGSRNPHHTCKCAVTDTIFQIGLLRGKPPAFPWETGYLHLYNELKEIEKKRNRKALAELAILKFQLYGSGKWKPLNSSRLAMSAE